MSEEQIYTSIFTYVDHLFGKIKPKKLFFMAVDGVAPRAKMNQQRSRRFRTAREARELREKAERKGEKLPESKPFDSNCITPGASPHPFRGGARGVDAARDVRDPFHGQTFRAATLLRKQEDKRGHELARCTGCSFRA